VSDAAVLVRSMAGDAATKAADRLQPSEEQMVQIDAPAEDNTWHDAPDISRQKLQNQIKGISPFGKKAVKDAATDGVAVAHPEGKADPADATAIAVQDKQAGAATGVDPTAGARAAGQSLKDKTDGDTKGKFKEYSSRSQNYLKGKMPKERREQTIWRLKKMVGDLEYLISLAH
jgi:hypothetical protein